MNSAVVIKAEYRVIGSEQFTDLDIVPYSGSITEAWQKSMAGMAAKVTVGFKKEKWSAEFDSVAKGLLNRKAQYRITDANGVVRLVGTDQIPARLLYDSRVGAAAGSFNGYEFSIDWLSPDGCELV